MSVADWVILAVTTLLVLALGGLPEQVTDELVAHFAVHRSLGREKLHAVTYLPIQGNEPSEREVEVIIQWFNESVYLGRVSKVYLPKGQPPVSLRLIYPDRCITLFPFRTEVGVLLKRRHGETFYRVRSPELSRLLNQEAV